MRGTTSRGTKVGNDKVEGGADICDRGDLLYNGGKEDLFAILSSRTSTTGAKFLRNSFAPRGFRIVLDLLDLLEQGRLTLSEPFLHQKLIVTCIYNRTLLLPRGRLDNKLFRWMHNRQRGCTSLYVSDVALCTESYWRCQWGVRRRDIF